MERLPGSWGAVPPVLRRANRLAQLLPACRHGSVLSRSSSTRSPETTGTRPSRRCSETGQNSLHSASAGAEEALRHLTCTQSGTGVIRSRHSLQKERTSSAHQTPLLCLAPATHPYVHSCVTTIPSQLQDFPFAPHSLSAAANPSGLSLAGSPAETQQLCSQAWSRTRVWICSLVTFGRSPDVSPSFLYPHALLVLGGVVLLAEAQGRVLLTLFIVPTQDRLC